MVRKRITKEQKQQRNLERIKNFRLLDDDFMTACFQDNIEATELLVQIIMGNNDLHVIDVKTQYTVKNIHGRSVRLDIYATDNLNKKYNIEIQRLGSGAGAKRARLNSSLIDAREIPEGIDSEELPETYVIFITEGDILGDGLPIYHVDRYISESGKLFGDEAHIIYVNAEAKDESPLGRLMADFSCTNPEDMYYSKLAKRVHYFKRDMKGVDIMCKAMEEMVQEGRYEEKLDIVENLLELGDMSDERIAKATGVSLEEVLEIKEELQSVLEEAERISKDPAVKGYTDIDELFADLEK
jgi:hypothetical protein